MLDEEVESVKFKKYGIFVFDICLFDVVINFFGGIVSLSKLVFF